MVIGLVVVAVLSVVIALAARTPPPVEATSEPTLSVYTLAPSQGAFSPVLFLIGQVEAIDSAVLTSPIASEVRAITAREGESFKRGQSIIRLDVREIEQTRTIQNSELEQLESQINALNINHHSDRKQLQRIRQLTELAENQHQRNLGLSQQNVLSQSQLEESEQNVLQQQLNLLNMEKQVKNYPAQLLQLESQQAAAQARMEQTNILLARSRIAAPFAGQVAEVLTAQGTRVAAGTPLVNIFNPDALRLRVSVPQRYAAVVKNKTGISAVIKQTHLTLTVSLSGFSPAVETGSSAIEVFFNLPQANEWILGESLDVVFQLPPIDAVAVPADAIYNDNYVYRLDARARAELVECERLGLTQQQNIDGSETQILLQCAELINGDVVVANQVPNIISGVQLVPVQSP